MEQLDQRCRRLIAAGQAPEALGELVVGLAAGRGNVEAARLMARLLGRYRLEPSAHVIGGLRAASDFDELDLQPLVRSTVDCWLAEPAWQRFARAAPADLDRLVGEAVRSGGLAPFDDVLLHRLLARAICHDATLERILTAVRRALLLGRSGELANGWMELADAFARHGLNNEFAWFVAPDENAAVEALAERVMRAGRSDPAEAARLGMYRPWPPRTDRDGAPPAPPPIEPADATSDAVRAQYEENPYPRWLALNPPVPGERRARLLAVCGASDTARFHGPIDVLIAGCGTGRQAIIAALGYGPTARVTAIDVSRNSLAYAARMAARYAVDSIRFMQADILKLDGRYGDFDVIEAIGVLHHLADPIAGWQALAQRLKPGGLMSVALYSERGRQDVVAARREIAALGLSPTPDGIRELRKMVLDAPADARDWRATVRRFTDFFSMSGCRDLLFNVQEHRFTPREVGEAVRAVGLELRSVEVSPAAAAAYGARFPDDPAMLDMANWDRFEADRPTTFSGMIGVWCRKAG